MKRSLRQDASSWLNSSNITSLCPCQLAHSLALSRGKGTRAVARAASALPNTGVGWGQGGGVLQGVLCCGQHWARCAVYRTATSHTNNMSTFPRRPREQSTNARDASKHAHAHNSVCTAATLLPSLPLNYGVRGAIQPGRCQKDAQSTASGKSAAAEGYSQWCH